MNVNEVEFNKAADAQLAKNAEAAAKKLTNAEMADLLKEALILLDRVMEGSDETNSDHVNALGFLQSGDAVGDIAMALGQVEPEDEK